MSDFKAKMHQIRFLLRAPSQNPTGELTALPQGPISKGVGNGREGRKREGMGGNGKGGAHEKCEA